MLANFPKATLAEIQQAYEIMVEITRQDEAELRFAMRAKK